jgi:hypothetical protein
VKKVLFLVLRLVGAVFIVGGLLAASQAYDAQTESRKNDQEVTKTKAQMKSGRGSGKQLKEDLEKTEGLVEEKKKESYYWWGGAAVALVLGAGLLLFPAPRKRKAPKPQADPVPIPNVPGSRSPEIKDPPPLT